MNFSFYWIDIPFFILFTIFVILFIYKRPHNIKKHGWMYLYHTKIGLEFMENFAKKWRKILKPLEYVIIATGYFLMFYIIWLLFNVLYKYFTSAALVQTIKVPPILPLIPYFPQLFKLESFFPPLYFTYFLIAIAIVATIHEFAHGIFARLNKIKIKSTGVAFFGPFFGAFVEQDEKQMNKSTKRAQLAVLAAGVFSNILMFLLFSLIMFGFFSLAYEPVGVKFNDYASSIVNFSEIEYINNIQLNKFDFNTLNESFVSINVSDKIFFVPGNILKKIYDEKIQLFVAYDNSPAFNAKLQGPIIYINGVATPDITTLKNELLKYKPGDRIIITSKQKDVIIDYDIELGSRDDGKAYLGIGQRAPQTNIIYKIIMKVKDPFIYYEPIFNAKVADFIYDLLWWIIIINLLVALTNMLPVGILDGGRFFYLTILGLTGSKKIGEQSFKWATRILLFILLLMTIRWAFVIF